MDAGPPDLTGARLCWSSMPRYRRLAVLLVLVAAPIAPWPATSTAGATSRHAQAIPDLTALFGPALERVRQSDHGTFSRATLLEADGITRGGGCTDAGCTDGRPVARAAGIVAWRFVFQNATPHSRYQSVTLVYGPAPKRFGRVRGHSQPFLEDVSIARAPEMTVARAVSLLHRAGYRRKFLDVTLREPLGPKPVNPLYIFTLTNGHYVAVDTRSGKVSHIH